MVRFTGNRAVQRCTAAASGLWSQGLWTTVPRHLNLKVDPDDVFVEPFDMSPIKTKKFTQLKLFDTLCYVGGTVDWRLSVGLQIHEVRIKEEIGKCSASIVLYRTVHFY